MERHIKLHAPQGNLLEVYQSAFTIPHVRTHVVGTHVVGGGGVRLVCWCVHVWGSAAVGGVGLRDGVESFVG